MTTNPEIGKTVVANGFRTNYHDIGQGDPVILIHGSGPGVSAWVNWRLTLPEISRHFRAIAPDMVGFGFSDHAPDQRYSMDIWISQLLGFLDELGIEKADLIGNSFGGALALRAAVQYPKRVRRLILMGSVGVPFPLTPGLDTAWGYTPSHENMAKLIALFAYNQALLTNDLVAVRYQASLRPGVQDAFGAMFPAPRQRWIDAMANSEGTVRAIPHHALIVHGRDDRIVPLVTSLTLSHWIERSQLHVFGQCGHWTQIEKAKQFSELVCDFLAEAQADEPHELNRTQNRS